jgi:hypothetical protein
LDLSTARDVRTADVEKICKLTNDVYRNRWITFAYWNISRRLKKLTGDNANWCTFSTWSSRTIGENLRIDKPTRRIDDLIYDEETSISVRDHPWVLRLQYLVTTRDKEAAQLALALGNRLIFHEIGYAMIQLLEWIERNPDADFQAWQSYRQLNVNAYPDIPKLFPLKDEDEFWDGLDTYVLASRAQTERTKAQLVLRGNVLLVAYEQKRLEPILKVALEPFPGHFVRVVQANPHAEAELSIPPGGKPWAQRDDCRVLKTIAEQFASFLTRYVMTLDAPLFAWAIRPLRLGRGIPRPDTRDTPYPPYLETLDGDVATLFEEHDLTGGAPERCGAHNWTDLADRMNHIVNLFRVGQQDPNLYRPLPDADLRALDLDFSKKKLDWLRTQGDDEVDDWFRSDAPEDIDPQPYVRALLDGGLEPLLGIPQFNPPPPLPRWEALARAAVLSPVRARNRRRALRRLPAVQLHGGARSSSPHHDENARVGCTQADRRDGPDAAGRHGIGRRLAPAVGGGHARVQGRSGSPALPRRGPPHAPQRPRRGMERGRGRQAHQPGGPPGHAGGVHRRDRRIARRDGGHMHGPRP